MKDAHVHITRLPHFLKTATILNSKGYSAVSSACAAWEWPALESLIPVFKDLTLAFGVHPAEIGPNIKADLETWRLYIENHPKSWVGEAGIDKRFSGYAPGEAQEIIFSAQAKVALEYKRPLVIHCVGDYLRVFKILSSLGFPAQDSPIHFHRFQPKLTLLDLIIDWDCFISLHSDSFRSKDMGTFLAQMPKNRIGIETDADESFAKPDTPPEAVAAKLLLELEKTKALLEKYLK